jgi:hypothetical protein
MNKQHNGVSFSSECNREANLWEVKSILMLV